MEAQSLEAAELRRKQEIVQLYIHLFRTGGRSNKGLEKSKEFWDIRSMCPEFWLSTI